MFGLWIFRQWPHSFQQFFWISGFLNFSEFSEFLSHKFCLEILLFDGRVVFIPPPLFLRISKHVLISNSLCWQCGMATLDMNEWIDDWNEWMNEWMMNGWMNDWKENNGLITFSESGR